MVFGIGTTETKASLALEFARDGALVMQLAKAFGGIEYLSDLSRDFIENWEVESYRSKQL
jgi:rhamnose utilization protein RhaD (predicted bifunctional aldolase and dehydrogenase)